MKAFRTIIVLALASLITFQFAYSAQEIFSVISANGNLQIQRNKTNKWDKLTFGTKIFAGDKIKINDKAYLNLFSKNKGKNLELKKSGEFTIAQLEEMISSNKSTLSSRFVSYVAENIGEKNYILSGDNKKNSMQVTGAVERGLPSPQTPCKEGKASNEIKLNLPRKINFIKDDVSFSWKPKNKIQKFIFVLTDRFDRPVLTKETNDQSFKINAAELKIQKDVYYFWHVASAADTNIKSEDCCFMILSDSQQKVLNDTLNLLKSELGSGKSAFNSIVLGNFYEQNLLMDEARKAYKEAVDIEPKADEYQKIYRLFLQRSNYRN